MSSNRQVTPPVPSSQHPPVRGINPQSFKKGVPAKKAGAGRNRSPRVPPGERGIALLYDPALNKGTAFTQAERDALGLRGLLPPRVLSLEQQAAKILENLRRKPNDIERYIQLIALQGRNETLFYRALIDNIEEIMPIVYTPTVGQACQEYGHIFRKPRGIFVSDEDHGRVDRILGNWPNQDVRVIVVTDGERILGLGDLGANGMGIPVGKLALYTACAGIEPSQCLPVTLDVGTNNESLLGDPLYIGVPKKRLSGEAYDALVDEFVVAAQKRFPKAVIQLEDFGNKNAFRLLAKYKDKVRIFDDDIQGTASVVLGGIYSALRITGQRLGDQRFVILGAGEAGIGIGELIVSAMTAEGVREDAARRQCWFFDSKGLIVKSRKDLKEHQHAFAQDVEGTSDVVSALDRLRPTAIIGVSGKGGVFTRAVIETMARINTKPIIFALSNPTTMSECTAEQAYGWSQGRAIFASGSPFPAVTINGRTYIPGQGNNSYIFPGVGLGVVASGARLVTDEMFFEASKALANEVTEADLSQGRIYPPLDRIRKVSLSIACAVAEVAYRRGLALSRRPDDLVGSIRSQMYEPVYKSYV
jgi:malate dehydrogenase (oxaloacetate-decarboxylating)(NADP+)